MAVRKEALAIVLDVGKSDDESCPTILEEAKRCISMIVQRKFFSESKDEMALILVGTSDTDTNITVVHDLQPANWELLKTVSEVKGTDIYADYFRDDALLTAISVLTNTFIRKKFFSRRILFLSCFDGYIYSNKVDLICEELKERKIDLNVIAPVAFRTEGTKKGSCARGGFITIPEKRMYCITKILKEVNGESYSFSDVLPALIYFQKKKVQAIPWNANLDIGTHLSIPISAYIKVCENKPKPWKDAYAFKLNAKITRGTTYFNESQSTVSVIDGFPCLTKDVSDIFYPGFKFGTTLVPYLEEDKEHLEYQSGEKGMKVLGFTSAENVQMYHYSGDKTMYVFGQKNRELAGVILAPFIHALNETDTVAIVRYVYSPRSAPKIGFLTPRIKENYECLMFVALPFREDLRYFQFSSLDSDPNNIPSEEQLSAVDELISAMDLTDPVSCEAEEMLKPKNTVNPHLQNLYQGLDFRVLNPEKPLPEVGPHIEALVTPEPKLLKRAATSLKKIKSLFPLSVLEADVGHTVPNGKSDEDFRKELMDLVLPAPGASTDKIVEVGSVNPVRDFQYLISNNVLPFNEVCQQMMDVVVKFLQDNAHLRMYHSKILSICKEFRSASLKEGNPVKYNSFMTNLRNVLLECDEELWNKIKSEKIGLISKYETPLRNAASVEQAERFLANHPQVGDKSSVTVIESFDANDEYGNMVSLFQENDEYGNMIGSVAEEENDEYGNMIGSVAEEENDEYGNMIGSVAEEENDEYGNMVGSVDEEENDEYGNMIGSVAEEENDEYGNMVGSVDEEENDEYGNMIGSVAEEENDEYGNMIGSVAEEENDEYGNMIGSVAEEENDEYGNMVGSVDEEENDEYGNMIGSVAEEENDEYGNMVGSVDEEENDEYGNMVGSVAEEENDEYGNMVGSVDEEENDEYGNMVGSVDENDEYDNVVCSFDENDDWNSLLDQL